MRRSRSNPGESADLSKPGDKFSWYKQVCTFWCGRFMVYAGRFGDTENGYAISICVVCQKNRRGQRRPHWYISGQEDLPKVGELITAWEQRKKESPGVFT